MPKNTPETIIDTPFVTSRRGGTSTSPSGGATTLLGLTDTPATYAGAGEYLVKVKATEDGIEFVAGSGGAVDSVNGQTGVVVLDTDDVSEGSTNKYTTATSVGAAVNIATTDDTLDDTDVVPYATGSTLKKTAWSVIKSTLKTYFDTRYDTIGAATAALATAVAAIATHAALTVTHGATGAIVGTTNAQSLTNKTLDSTNIASLTAKNPPVDADSAVIVDSAASNVFKRVTYTNIKAFLKTYFDTLYDLTGTAITALSTKTTPVDADDIVITDSAASNAPKRVTGTNYKAYFKTYFDTLYDLTATAIAALSGKTTPVDADGFVIADSAASNAPKKVTGTNLKAYLKTYFDTLYNLYVHPNHTGDVTSVGDGATTIAANAVTNAKLANMADSTVKGQIVGGSGAPVDLTKAQLIAIIEAQAIYALLAGRAGSQILNGGTAANEDLTLRGTAHATKTSSYVLLQDTGGNVGIGAATAPAFPLSIGGTSGITRLSVGTGNAGDADGRISFAWNIGTAIGYLDTYQAGYKQLVIDGNPLLLAAVAANQVGVGIAPVSAKLGVIAGTSSNDAAVGGVLLSDAASHGNISTPETTLSTYTIPANTLAANGQTLYFEFSVNVVNNGNNKQIKFYFGSTTVTVVNDVGGGAAYNRFVRGRIIRTGAATQLMFTEISGSSATRSTPTETLSGTIVTKVTGDGDASNDMNLEYFKIWWDDANT